MGYVFSDIWQSPPFTDITRNLSARHNEMPHPCVQKPEENVKRFQQGAEQYRDLAVGPPRA